jgi:hypothetical protein
MIWLLILILIGVLLCSDAGQAILGIGILLALGLGGLALVLTIFYLCLAQFY